MGNDLVLSASSVAAYNECHYRWRLEYIEGYPSTMGIGAAVGQAVHSGVEAYYKARMSPVLVTDSLELLTPDQIAQSTALDTYRTTYLFETAGMADPDEPIDKVMLQGERVLQVYMEEVGFVTEPDLVEYGFLITVNGILFSGHMDLADKDRLVRDLKVSKQKPRDPESRYGFARVGYSLGYREMIGEQESGYQLDIMIRLKRDRPYHLPITYEPATDREIGVFAAKLERTALGIDKGDFLPTGLGRICGWCSVSAHCEYYANLITLQGGHTKSETPPKSP